jgi:hypothetical protein
MKMKTKNRLPFHESITAELISEACERSMSSLDSPGFCVGCGAEHDGFEPDARNCECESCGELNVFGAEELALMMF